MKNDVVNYPIQGSAFHCELQCIIWMLEKIRKFRMKSLIVGQIHDCDVADVPRKELQQYLDMIHELKTVTLPQRWKWICVPMTAEAEVSERGTSWAAKREWVRGPERWALKA